MSTQTTAWTIKIVVAPIDHFAGARFTRRTWRAELATIADGETVEVCEHRMGHKTTDAAVRCGRAMAARHGR